MWQPRGLRGLLSWALSVAGQLNAERLPRHLSVRGRPGRHQRGGQQRRPAADGARGQGAPQAGAGQPHGGLEVLHVLGLLGVPPINAQRGAAGPPSPGPRSPRSPTPGPGRSTAARVQPTSSGRRASLLHLVSPLSD